MDAGISVCWDVYIPYRLYALHVTSSPGPFPAFQRATLKSWEWAWGRGYIACVLVVDIEQQ